MFRRNCGDLAITVLGLVWIVFHFLFQFPAYMAGGIKQWKKLTYTFGYLVVILRFFTIAGTSLFMTFFKNFITNNL